MKNLINLIFVLLLGSIPAWGDYTFKDSTGATQTASAVTDGSQATIGAKADAACATDNGTCSVSALIKRTNQNLTSSTVTTGTFGTPSSAVLSVQNGATDPCQNIVKTYTPINIISSTTTRIISPTSAKKTYICSIDIFAFVANNIAIVEGTGGTCGSGTAGVVGGTTTATGISFPTQGGLAKGTGANAVWSTAGTNVDFCLITSTAGPLAGHVVWVQAP